MTLRLRGRWTSWGSRDERICPPIPEVPGDKLRVRERGRTVNPGECSKCGGVWTECPCRCYSIKLENENRRLTARVAELEAALAPFTLTTGWADLPDDTPVLVPSARVDRSYMTALCVGDLRRAAALVGQKEEP